LGQDVSFQAVALNTFGLNNLTLVIFCCHQMCDIISVVKLLHVTHLLHRRLSMSCGCPLNRLINIYSLHSKQSLSPLHRLLLPDCSTQYLTRALILGLEQYWHWVIGYWAIFADIG